VLYALTACIAGYVATSYYVQMEGQGWVQNILVTCFCYCGPFFCMFMFLNTVAIVYRVSPQLLAAQYSACSLYLLANCLCSGSCIRSTASVQPKKAASAYVA
jgi:hypothetical protein